MFEAIEEDYETGLELAEELIRECQRQDLSTGPALGAALAVIFKELMDETPNPQAMMGRGAKRFFLGGIAPLKPWQSVGCFLFEINEQVSPQVAGQPTPRAVDHPWPLLETGAVFF